jgi:hypothetical protein
LQRGLRRVSVRQAAGGTLHAHWIIARGTPEPELIAAAEALAARLPG